MRGRLSETGGKCLRWNMFGLLLANSILWHKLCELNLAHSVLVSFVSGEAKMSSHTKTTSSRFLPGSFLVATPYIQDSPYRRSVVLVMRHDAQGALGFVMDDQLKTRLGDLETFFSATMQRGRPTKQFPGMQFFSAIVRWPAGKLESEVDQGIWMTTPARLEVAMACENLWKHLLQEIGLDVLRDGLGIKTFPEDIRLN